MLTIAVDVDDTTIRTMDAILEIINRQAIPEVSIKEITTWDVYRCLDEKIACRVMELYDRPTTYYGASLFDGAEDVIAKFRADGHRVIFVTSPTENTWGIKLKVLQLLGLITDSKDYVETRDKGLVKADALIDDNPDNLKRFDGIRFLYDRPWNREVGNDYPTMFRCGSWGDIKHAYVSGFMDPGAFSVPSFRDVDELLPAETIRKLMALSNQHPTEEKYPQQVGAFREIIDGLLELHLEKNADYSPANIKSTGEIGLAVREFDKILRVLNLTGFDVDVNFLGFRQPKDPRFESLNDNIRDIAVYAINWLIYRQGKWGK